jgi:hypothetical protein
MRLLMNARIPHQEFNAAVKDGTVVKKLGKILDELRPETVYFTEQQGRRGCIMVLNIDDPADVPRCAEPFFLMFNADVEFHVAMTPDDLRKAGLDELRKKWL